jgi:uncharacterized membrane protein YuzA (DUF378 family)
MKLKTWSKWLVVLGALEVGLMGAFGFDLVGSLLGSWPMVVRFVYVLVLASALWGVWAMLMGKKK